MVLKATDEPAGCCRIIHPNSLHTAAMESDEAEILYYPFLNRSSAVICLLTFLAYILL